MKALVLVVLCCACAGLSRKNPLESNDILARPEVSQSAGVQHILVGWSWLEGPYRRMGMTLDPRAQARNETKADELATQLLAKCSAGQPFEPLMKQWSEDTGSAGGVVMTVDASSQFVEPFKDLALRLKPSECGLVRSQFGWHVMKRVK